MLRVYQRTIKKCTHVVRLEITMEDPVGMAESDAGENLLHETPNHGSWQPNAFVDIVTGLILIHKALQIVRHVFKYEIQTTGLGLDDIH